jgi:WbqC-like protein family
MNDLRIAIHQPNFMPWLGYFHKMSMVDVFVLLDDVQVPQGKSFASRALIKTNTGELWITVPTLDKPDKADYRNTQILNSNWKNKTLKTIKLAYQKAPFFNSYFDAFAETYMAPSQLLFELNYRLIVFFQKSLGIQSTLKISSELGGNELIGAEKIHFILDSLSANTYVSGKGGGSMRYIDESAFKAKNIKLIWQEFHLSEYPQLHDTFIPKLSALDYLFNCGESGQAFAQ